MADYNNMSCAEACYAGRTKRLVEGYLVDQFLLISMPLSYLFTYLTTKIPFFSQTLPLPYELAQIYAQNGIEYNYGMIIQSLAVWVVMFLYFFLMEWLTKGKTLGKYICKTVVVDKDGNTPSAGRLLLRTLCRLIPFDALSYLFSFWRNGTLHGAWHDKLSGTYVVEADLLEEWKAGNYDGSDRLGAMFGRMMREQGMEMPGQTDTDEQEQEEGGEHKLRVEDLYPSDDDDN